MIPATASGEQPITITSTSSRAANGQLNGGSGSSTASFFSNSGAVGGTFAGVGIVAALIIAGIVWLFYRRRKNQRMDADVVAAAGAAAATTRTPFDDDDHDPEMMEGYGTGSAQHGFYGESNYAPSMLSGPGAAGQGAYNGAYGAAGAAAAGAAGYYHNGSEVSAHHYYDPQSTTDGGYYQGPASGGHDGPFSNAGSHPDDQMYAQQTGWSNGGYGQAQYASFADGGAAAYGASHDNSTYDSNVNYQQQGYSDYHQSNYSNAQGERSGPPVLPNPHAETDSLLGPNVFGEPSPTEDDSPSGNGSGGQEHSSDPYHDYTTAYGSNAGNGVFEDEQEGYEGGSGSGRTLQVRN